MRKKFNKELIVLSQGLLPTDLPKLSTLKLGGLNHPRFLHEMTAAVGETLIIQLRKELFML